MQQGGDPEHIATTIWAKFGRFSTDLNSNEQDFHLLKRGLNKDTQKTNNYATSLVKCTLLKHTLKYFNKAKLKIKQTKKKL